MKFKSIAFGLVLILIFGGGIMSVQAGKIDDCTGALNGPHKNLNIISVAKPKNENFNGGNGARIFVLRNITTKFYVGASDDYELVDHDATDRYCGAVENPGMSFPSEDDEWKGHIFERFLGLKTNEGKWVRYYPDFYPDGVEYVYFFKYMLQMRIYLE